MRILHVPSACPPVLGGAETYCWKLSEALSAKHHEVTIATSDVAGHHSYYAEPSKVSAPAQEVRSGVTLKRLPYYAALDGAKHKLLSALLPSRLFQRVWAGTTNKRYREFRNGLEQVIVRGNPDVVMTTPHDMTNVRCVLEIASSHSFPLVFVPMLHPDIHESHKNWYRSAMERADAVVTNTSMEAAVLAEDFGVPREKVFVGWLGVEPSAHPIECERQRQVLCLGRIAKQKCIDSLARAMVRLWDGSGFEDVKLIVAGGRGPDSAAVEADVRASAGRHWDKIEILYDIPEAQKDLLLASSSCLVLPSPSESFGLVLIEAMARKTPVIALDLPVFRSFIDNGTHGILTSPGDADAMAKAVRKLLGDRMFADRLGNAGHDLVRTKFTWPAVADNYLRAYEYAIAQRQGAMGRTASRPSL